MVVYGGSQTSAVRGRLVIAVWFSLCLVPGAPAATGILAAGDFGVGGAGERELGLAMRRFEAQRPAELFVTLGDNDYTASPQRFGEAWNSSFGWLEPGGVAVAGVLGNHDLDFGDGGRYEFATLGLRRRYAVRRVGDVELFLLDSNRVDRTETTWLRRSLARSTARWRIAVFHHPPYTCGGHEGDEDVQTSWLPLFESYGVQLVLSGHDHNYQRFRTRRGVAYVVHGGGNTNLYGLRPCPVAYPRRVAALRERGFLYLVAGAGALSVSAVRLDGSIADRFTVYP